MILLIEMLNLFKLIIFVSLIASISQANFEFLKAENEDLQIIWTRSQSLYNDCVIRVQGLDIMSKKFTIKRNLSKINHVEIPKNVLQPGTSVGGCLTCQSINSQGDLYCENYLVKPLPINNAKCEEEENRIRFEFDRPRDGQFDNFQVDIEPDEWHSMPRILSKNMDHITFMNLKPGRSYKITAMTLAGQEEVSYSDHVELICKTKNNTNAQDNLIKDKLIHMRSTRANTEDDKMFPMIQSQTAIMKMMIMMTLIVLIILVMSTITLSHLLRVRRHQLNQTVKSECEHGKSFEYKKLKNFQ